jgi:NTP pyrophosphatase (non-canonical NTP hydrolase)
MKNLEFWEEFTRLCDEISDFGARHWPPVGGADPIALALANVGEEFGEISRIFAKRWSGKRLGEVTQEALAEEFADIMGNLIAMMQTCGLDQTRVMHGLLRKWSDSTGDPTLVERWLE